MRPAPRTSRYARIIAITVLSLSPALTAASVWHVPGDAGTIQGGIDLASAGDTVLVAPGPWSGAGNVNLSFGGVDLVLLSSGGRDVTTINCAHASRAIVFLSGESASAVMQGFTIRDGSAPTGGGILIDEASPTIRDCRFVSCYASNHGGAADLQDSSSPTFEDCVFDSNSTSGQFHTGGAIQLLDDGSFIRCTFRDNQAGGIGGAIRLTDSGNITFEGCVFERNAGTDGGAVMNQGAVAMGFDSCTFVENQATNSGGAVGFTGGLNSFSECLFDMNSAEYGGAVYVLLGAAILQSCTVARTTTGAASAALSVTNAGSDIDIYNTIVYGTLTGAAVKCNNYGDVTPVCSDFYGNAGGDWDPWCGAGEDTLNGNFSEDPRFCDPDNGDFRLSADSPCLDAPGCGLVGAFGQGCGSGIVDRPTDIGPNVMALGPAIPNPFGPRTRICYTIPMGAGNERVRLWIHDVCGRLVRDLVDRHQPGGGYTVSWDGTDESGAPVAGGVYFYQLMLNGETQTRRMLLVR